MSTVYTDSSNYSDIADAIREVSGDESATFTPSEMGNAIRNLNVSPVYGVKGDAETDYRTGYINLTAANIGVDKEYAKLGAVDETNEKLTIHIA